MTTVYQIITILFGSGVLTSVVAYILKRIKDNDKKTTAVCLGVQALLRDRLIETYNKYKERGWAPIYAKENFENMYQQYHKLGVNGVMDDIYAKFMALDTQPKEE